MASSPEPTPRRRRSSYQPPGSWQTVSIDDLNGTARGVPLDQQGRLSFASELFCVGDLALVQRLCVAIVGTRKVSDAGRLRTRRIARELVESGVVVVSGLAAGVDHAAHTAALDAGGRTIAVIGTPVTKAYPADHAQLQESIYRDHLLVSPFPDGQRTFPSHFPERNKVMAALTDATVIVEAGETSGTIHQAAECQRLGRWLFFMKSLVDDPSVTWPRSFLGAYERAVMLTDTQQVLSAIGA